MKFDHQKLSTYGIGKDYSKKQWFQMSRQFLRKGLMTQDMQYGSLMLSDKAYEIFRGEGLVFGILEEERIDYAQGKESIQDYDQALFEMLRKKRKELADQANVPPYIIFPDKTLIELAIYFPQSEENLLNIHGVGAEKLKKYGDVFLQIVKAYCRTNQINEQPRKQYKSKAVASKYNHKQRHIVIGEAYNNGRTVKEIMAEFSIKQNTVLDHLARYIDEGFSIKPDGLLELSTIPADQQAVILKTFERLGHERLTPVFEALDGEISYDELKIVRLCYLCKNLDDDSK